jgi:hypothetical protein
MTLLCLCASNQQENTMPQSTHDRTAELHNLAEHAHAAASAAHGKGDHLTGHELSKKALEHSMNAYRHSEEILAEMKVPRKA